MTKKIIMAKQPALDRKGNKAKGRVCLNCGINIDHRSAKVEFCCSACKKLYTERLEFEAKDKPRLKVKYDNSINDAASVYYQDESRIAKFQRRFGKTE